MGYDFLTIFGSVNFVGVVTKSEKHYVSNSTLDFLELLGFFLLSLCQPTRLELFLLGLFMV